MAKPVKIKDRFRMIVRRGGQTRCQTFATAKAATNWGRIVEREIDELKSVGYVQPKGETFGDIVDKYIRELYPIKPWGRSKASDLARLKRELGSTLVEHLTHEKLMETFMRMARDGAGGVTISARAGYLLLVLETAKDVWRLNVPVEAARSARSALSKIGLIKKGRQRDRRVTDAELERVIAHVERKATAIPFRDIVWFSVATAMRISEVCRLHWEDLNETDKTIRIRDRKHPSQKIGNHQIVPLLENLADHNAYALVKKQPQRKKRIFPVNAKTVGSYFTAAVQQLGIDDLHFHDIRHEACSRLFEAGFRIEQVSLISGHRDWSMLKRYTHIVARDLHPKKVIAA